MTPRVLIIHASTGNGHISAANAVEVALKAKGADCRVIDGLTFAPLAFRTWYGGGYEATVRVQPKAWGWLYRISDHPGFAFRVQSWSDNFFLRRLERVIREFRPQVVVCTHSLPQPKLARLRRKYGFRIVVVVTDLYPHKMWLRGHPDWFYVPQPWSQEILNRRLPASRGRTSVTGIPVHAVFANVPSQVDSRRALNVPDGAPMAVLSAGGIGAGDFPGAVQALADIEGLHLYVICGRNDAAFADLVSRNLTGKWARLEILKRVPIEDMAMLMSAADLLIGKPGGLTVSEALAVGVPFVVHMPFMIPGQEEDNARYLVEEGIGVRCVDNAEMGAEVARLLANPDLMREMRVKSKAAGQPQSADQIADHVIHLARQ